MGSANRESRIQIIKELGMAEARVQAVQRRVLEERSEEAQKEYVAARENWDRVMMVAKHATREIESN